MDTAVKTEIDNAKIDSKRVEQNTGEETGDLIGSKIANTITSVGRSNSEKEKKKKEKKNKKMKQIKYKKFIYHQKNMKLLTIYDFFRYSIKWNIKKLQIYYEVQLIKYQNVLLKWVGVIIINLIKHIAQAQQTFASLEDVFSTSSA